MEVKLTERLYGAPDGEVNPRWFEVGDTVTGDLAESAIAEGKAAAPAKKRTPPEAAHKKQSSASQRAPRSRKKTAT